MVLSIMGKHKAKKGIREDWGERTVVLKFQISNNAKLKQTTLGFFFLCIGLNTIIKIWVSKYFLEASQLSQDDTQMVMV